MRPKSAGGASEKALANQTQDSVFDFLYHDVQRIASFLAQFDQYGHLQQLRQSESMGDEQIQGTTGDIEVKAVVVEGGLTQEKQKRISNHESIERTYDPLWTNARALLDFLTERDMIHRELEKARIGQFVMATGQLSILDMKLIKELWQLPAVKRSVQAGDEAPAMSRQQRRALERTQGQATPTAQPLVSEFAIEVLPKLPHTIQAYLVGTGIQLWSTLREECMVVSATDLLLKHGVQVQGDWTMLGILDARPDDAQPEVSQTGDVVTRRGVAPGLLAQLLETFAPAIRTILGRPAEAYGLTPLLVFRDVSG